MDNINTNQQAPRTLAEAQARIVPPPAGARPSPLINKNIIMIVAGVLGLGILIFGFLYLRSSTPPKEEVPVAVTPTTLPSPTPPPNLSRLSTTSAFMRYSDEVASFSAILNAFRLQDATLVPPILDIELDLKN